MSKVNEISVLRKRVVTNIPGFDDDETGKPQNTWFKLYDFTCVDTAPGLTARVYNLEHAENYDNNDTQYYIEFHQGGEHHFLRIVKIITVQLFATGGCCVFQLICNVTNPRAVERLQACGILSIIPDDELEESEGESE